MLEKTGTPEKEDIELITPSAERRAKGPIAIVECFRQIPCDPCYTSCPRGAIKEMADINDIPTVDEDKCNGCGVCVSRCPGLAITVIDESYQRPEDDNEAEPCNCVRDEALVRLPYEFLPLPAEGSFVTALDRDGRPVCRAAVVKVQCSKTQDRTPVVTLAVPRELSMTVRFFNPEDYFEDNSVICRCEEIRLDEIRALIRQGFTTVDEIKRMSRAGMGPCQGRTCRHLIQREISALTGVSPEDQPMPMFRPPVKPLRMGALFEAVGDEHE